MRHPIVAIFLGSLILSSYLPLRSFLGDTSIGFDSVEVRGGDDLASIKAEIPLLEETGFGGSLDGVIDRVLASNRLVFLFFYADWCHFCTLEKPIIDELSTEFSDTILFLRLNEKLNPEAVEAFMVDGYPTMFLVYGEDADGYRYVEFRGYKEKTQLQTDLEYVVTNLSPPPTSESNLRPEIKRTANEGGPHHTCDVDSCLSDCHFSEGLYEEIPRVLYELTRFIGECGLCVGAIAECASLCTTAAVACVGTVGAACAPGLALCAGCFGLIALAEVMPGPSCLGCIDDFNWLREALRTLADTLEACDSCCDNPMTCEYGVQECKDPSVASWSPDADRCVGNSIVSMTCQECEWEAGPGAAISPCPEGTYCVETGMTMAECRPKDEDDDGDDCTGTSCRDGDGDGGRPASGPGSDHPDDNQIFADQDVTIPDVPPTIPDVAILRRGYYDGAVALLATIGEVTTLLDFNFPEDLAAQYPVLIIPSGGLYGVGSSSIFEAKLEAYVAAGGTLIVLSQQTGDDYRVLPGTVGGFGWIEDQSCQSHSVAMSVYHPVLSGFNPTRPYEENLDLRVDGFFTTWPDDALVLLSRVKNGQPAVVLYPYGNGQVVATTLFTDYNMLVSLLQTPDEREFFLNLITWAKHPQPVANYAVDTFVDIPLNLTSQVYDTTFYAANHDGDMIDLTVTVTNRGTDPSSQISFLLLDSLYQAHALNVSAELAPNETRAISISLATGPSPPEGVWYVLYRLSAGDRTIWAGLAGAFTVSVDLDTLSTYTVVFTLIDPTGQVVERRNVSTVVEAMATTLLHFTYTLTEQSTMGIWSVDYVVYDYREMIVDFGVKLFAVSYYQSSPSGWSYQGAELAFTVTTDREYYLYGTPANFTFHLWNNGEASRNVTVTWGVHHHAAYGVVPEGLYDAFAAWVIVPASGYVTFNYTLPTVVDWSGDRLRARFYIDGSCVGAVERGFYAYGYENLRSNLDFKITTDSDAYRSGDTAIIQINATSRLNFAYDTRLSLHVARGGAKADLWNTAFDVHLLNASSITWLFNFTLPSSTEDGIYTVMLDILDYRTYWAATTFTILPYEVTVAIDLPEVVYPHALATGALTLNNTGDQDLQNMTVAVAFLDPDQRVQWNATASFPLLSVNQTAVFPFAIPVSDVHLGTYQLAYEVTFNPQKTVLGTVDLPSSLALDLAFDRAAYREGEAVGTSVEAVNDGRFVQNRSLRLEVPDLGYTTTWNILVLPGTTQQVAVAIPLPSDIAAGVHEVRLGLQDAGNWTIRTYKFTVPESRLRVILAETRYAVDEDIQVKLQNLGGVDTTAEYMIVLVGATGTTASPQTATALVPAGASVDIGYPITASLLTGRYDLRVETRNVRTNATRTTRLPLWIDGVDVEMNLTTDREVYLPSDVVNVISQLVNTGARLDNGTLLLDIVAALPGVTATNWTTYTPPPIGTVDVIAFDPNGNLWVGGYNWAVRYKDGAWDHYTPKDGLPGGYINSIVVDADGLIWAGAEGTFGLSVFDSAKWTRLNETTTGLAFTYVTALAVGIDGDVWVGSRSGVGLRRFNGTHWTTYNTTNSGLVSNNVGCIAVDLAGNVWIGGGRDNEFGVTVYNGTHWTTYTRANTSSGLRSDRVDTIAFDQEGNVWIGHNEYYGGISVFNGTAWITASKGISLPGSRVRQIVVDADGNVWIATDGGVALYDGSTWTHYTQATSGLETSNIVAMTIDSAGYVWVGYNDFPGVSFFNGSQWARLVPTIIDARVYDVAVGADGAVWFATYGGISRFDGNVWTYFTAKTSGLPSDIVSVLDFDQEGRPWVGTRLGISMYNGSAWISYDEANTGVDLSATDAFAADPYGNLWFASQTRLDGVIRFNGTHWTTYNTTNSGLASDDVRALLVDASGDLWIATAGGMNWYDGTGWHLFNASNSALGSDDVIDLAVDSQNRIWIVHGLGVNVFDRTTWTTYDRSIFEDLGIAVGFFSTIALDSHDRVWVGTGRMFTTSGRGYGALTYDGHAWTKYNVTNSGIASNFINAIAFTQDHVWFGTDYSGVSVLTTTEQAPSPVLWQANLTLSLPGSAFNATTITVEPLSVTGKLYLRGALFSAGEQVITSAVHPFYVVDGPLLLTVDLDNDVYPLGETVALTGTLRNLDVAQAIDGVTVTVRDGAILVYQASVDLSANGTHLIATNYVAASAGEHTIEATVARGGLVLLTVLDRYTVATPSVAVEVTAPEVVGWDPFPVAVLVNNTGITEATVTVNGTAVTLAPREVQFLDLMTQVNGNATIAVVCSGDYAAAILVDVVLGARATLTLTPSPVYREGIVAIPYELINTGSMDINASVVFTVDGDSMVREIYLPAHQNLTGVLILNLTVGTYTLTYEAIFGSGAVDVVVTPPNRVAVTVDAVERVNGTLQVPVTVTNVGANVIVGQVRLLADIYQGDVPLMLPIGASSHVLWNVSLTGIAAGTYNASVEVFAAGASIVEEGFTLQVSPPLFAVVDVPVNASSPWGTLANLTITVRNAGDAAGDAEVTLTVPGIYAATRAAWIPADAVVPYTFTVPIPDDVAAGWYPVVVTLSDVRREIALYVQGANVSVSASADRPLYVDGANATVTLRVVNHNGLNLTLFATVHNDAYEAGTPFNLPGHEAATLAFDVPLIFDGKPTQTVLYTVSLASGRAFFIGDLYLYAHPPASSGIALYADRQTYAIGDTVTVTVNASRMGAFTASAPSFSVEEQIDGLITYNFTVPPLRSGTYAIDYTFDDYAASCPFDVDGYAARIIEMTLDKEAYAVGEDVRLAMAVDVRRAFEALIRVTVYDQLSVPIDRHSFNVSLAVGVNRVEVTRPIPIGGLGLYAINPRIYVDLPGHSYSLVTSGARFFDVAADDVPPALMIRSPENATYLTEAIWLNVTANEACSWMGYSLDGGANVTFTGSRMLLGVPFGPHRVMVYANDTSGNMGASTEWFTISADPLPPEIVHVPVTGGIEGEPIDIYAMVTDNAQVEEVALYYRAAGDQNYVELVMTECQGCIDTYNATIPATAVTTATIAYYITATDGLNAATSGTAEHPYVIQINFYPAAVVLDDPTDVSENSMKLIWTGSADGDFENYTIYRSEIGGVLGTPIHTIAEKSTTSYIVRGLTANTTYYFIIRVSDAGGLYADSNQITATTLATAEGAGFPWIPLVAGLSLAALIVIVVTLFARARRRRPEHSRATSKP